MKVDLADVGKMTSLSLVLMHSNDFSKILIIIIPKGVLDVADGEVSPSVWLLP